MRPPFQRASLLAGLYLSAAACGGGSGDDTSAQTPPVDVPPPPPVVTSFGGSVGDGPIAGGNVFVHAAGGALLTTVTSDQRANYRVSVSRAENDFPLRVEATAGIDLVTGTAPDFSLASAVLTLGPDQTVNLNPHSTLIVRAAARMPGGLGAANVAVAKSAAYRDASLGLTALAFPDPISTAVTVDNCATVVKASENFGETLRRTRDALAASRPGLTADSVLEALAADMADDALDGAGSPPSDLLITASWNVIAAQVLLESLPNELRVNGVPAAPAMDAAIVTVTNDPGAPLTGSVAADAQTLDFVASVLASLAGLTIDLSPLEAALATVEPGMPPPQVAPLLSSSVVALLDGVTALLPAASSDTLLGIAGRLSGSGNTPPMISGSPAASVAQGSLYSFTPVASDADRDPLAFSIVNRPSWAEFSAVSGSLTGTPGADNVGTTDNITIFVSDGMNEATLAPFKITVLNVNDPPFIGGTPPSAVVPGVTYEFTPTASDADGDALTFSIDNRPSWATFDTASGRLRGTPSVVDIGTVSSIVISVSDGLVSTALAAFSITVNNDNSAPTIGGTPLTAVMEGSFYSFTPSSSDPEGDPLTFSIANRPTWASFDSATGRLSGTPGASDIGSTAGIVIAVSDGPAGAALAPFSITVTSANRAPTIGGTPPTSVAEGSFYSFVPTADDSDGDELHFLIINRPAWASFDAATGQLSGTPGAGDIGTTSGIVIGVSDGAVGASLPAFSLTVAAINDPPQIFGSPPITIVQGSTYSFTPLANDPDQDTLMFTIVNKPAWAQFLATTGTLSGTPGAADIGTTIGIVITASDGVLQASLPAFDLTVTDIVSGSATLSWSPPVANSDGSALVDLAGYRIYASTQDGEFANPTELPNPGLTTYVVENLAPATWYFVITAYDVAGNESEFSNTAVKTIQ